MISCENIINKILEDLDKIDLEIVDLALKNTLKEEMKITRKSEICKLMQ